MPLPPHPLFEQPNDQSVPAWRYMDLTKLLSLLLREELYLARLDRLPDKFEGALPRQASHLLRSYLVAQGAPMAEKMVAATEENAKKMRRNLYVNCWHLGAFESEAMWRLYCGDDDGLAVRLPYGQLKDSLEHDGTFIGTVKYIDFESDVFNIGNVYNAALHKRREFEYEREARIVHCELVQGTLDTGGPPAIRIPWSPMVIDQIVISPYASDWYIETVRETVRRLFPGLAERITVSAMSAAP